MCVRVCVLGCVYVLLGFFVGGGGDGFVVVGRAGGYGEVGGAGVSNGFLQLHIFVRFIFS